VEGVPELATLWWNAPLAWWLLSLLLVVLIGRASRVISSCVRACYGGSSIFAVSLHSSSLGSFSEWINCVLDSHFMLALLFQPGRRTLVVSSFFSPNSAALISSVPSILFPSTLNYLQSRAVWDAESGSQAYPESGAVDSYSAIGELTSIGHGVLPYTFKHALVYITISKSK
jgi:hypothetical protein